MSEYMNPYDKVLNIRNNVEYLKIEINTTIDAFDEGFSRLKLSNLVGCLDQEDQGYLNEIARHIDMFRDIAVGSGDVASLTSLKSMLLAYLTGYDDIVSQIQWLHELKTNTNLPVALKTETERLPHDNFLEAIKELCFEIKFSLHDLVLSLDVFMSDPKRAMGSNIDWKNVGDK